MEPLIGGKTQACYKHLISLIYIAVKAVTGAETLNAETARYYSDLVLCFF